ncbi:MAG TPA: bifunctional ADP-heptose synthase [Fimbriimonas sp.]|nr:bifunctional ADP-heptose synthase [Fimbriimonas sp.]
MNGSDLLQKFRGVNALVVGDLMLDEYIFGTVSRISQEAPVMVVKQTRVSTVPGGAANVATNLMALGAQTGVVGAIGDDPAAEDLEQALRLSGVDPICILRDQGRPTTRKTRVIANHSHQVLRIDIEEEKPISSKLVAKLVKLVEENLEGKDVLLLSDYQKGAIPGEVIEKLITLCREKKVPVVANAKPGSAHHYRGASVVSLNRFEASSAAGLLKPLDDDQAEPIAKSLRDKLDIDSLIVTLGASGMVLANKSGTYRVPAIRVEVYDEAGAGDTVIATLALCAAVESLSENALRLATHTAAAVVRKVGVAVPTQEDLGQIALILR